MKFFSAQLSKTSTSRFAMGAGLLLAALAFTGCGVNSNPTQTGGAQPSSSGGKVVIGSADFAESEVIADIYGGALKAKGFEVSSKPSIGSREIYMKAIEDNSINLIPEYTGNLLGFVDKSSTQSDPAEIVKELKDKLPKDLTVLKPSGAEDKDSLVVTQATSEKYGLKSLEDLGKVCSQLTFGVPPEFEKRPYGAQGLKEKYNCEPKFDPIAGGALTTKALLEDQVQVADIFSTDPAIAANDLVVLEDPKHNFTPQQVVPLINTTSFPQAAQAVLDDVSSKLSTDDLIKLNDQVSGDEKRNPEDAANDWLKDKGYTN